MWFCGLKTAMILRTLSLELARVDIDDDKLRQDSDFIFIHCVTVGGQWP